MIEDDDYVSAWKKIMKDRGVSKKEAIKILEEELLIPYPWEDDELAKKKKKKNKKAIKAKRKVV